MILMIMFLLGVRSDENTLTDQDPLAFSHNLNYWVFLRTGVLVSCFSFNVFLLWLSSRKEESHMV